MIYKLINSKVVIGELFDRYNINYSSFIPRVPNWINRALRELQLNIGSVVVPVEGAVVNYKCELPDETLELLGISYEGKRLPRMNVINEYTSDYMPTLSHNREKYQLDNNGYIITTFETGDIIFYIRKALYEKDDNTQLYFPLIPNVEELLTGLENYVLMRLLLKGYKIPPLSLKENNEFTNPALAWKNGKKAIRGAINRLDADARQQISEQIRTLLVNVDFYYNENFNNTGG